MHAWIGLIFGSQSYLSQMYSAPEFQPRSFGGLLGPNLTSLDVKIENDTFEKTDFCFFDRVTRHKNIFQSLQLTISSYIMVYPSRKNPGRNLEGFFKNEERTSGGLLFGATVVIVIVAIVVIVVIVVIV